MAKYKLTQAAVVGDRYYGAGEEVEYDGTPGAHMEPVDDGAKKAAAAAAKEVRPAVDPDKLAHAQERTVPGRSPHAADAGTGETRQPLSRGQDRG